METLFTYYLCIHHFGHVVHCTIHNQCQISLQGVHWHKEAASCGSCICIPSGISCLVCRLISNSDCFVLAKTYVVRCIILHWLDLTVVFRF